MDRKSFVILALLGFSVLLVLGYMFTRPVVTEETAIEKSPTAEVVEESVPEESDDRPKLEVIEQKITTTQPSRTAIREEDMTPFMKTEIANQWMNEMGYTLNDIADAQQKIRDLGMSEESANDPGIIQRHIVPRHIGNVSIEKIIAPSFAKAGQPIPFTLKGTAPSPTFQFTRFDVLVQGTVIRIRAIGNSDANNESGLGDSVSLDGSIDPLAAGTYTIEVPELGPNGIYTVVVSQ